MFLANVFCCGTSFLKYNHCTYDFVVNEDALYLFIFGSWRDFNDW